MNYFAVLLATTLSSLTVKGQCPFSVANRSITSCDGSSKAGARVYIDFHKINSPCDCTVIPSIDGPLFILTEEVTISTCPTRIIVESQQYACPIQKGVTSYNNAIANQPVTVTASYKPSSNSGAFYHCLGFYQLSNGVQVHVHVTCGLSSTTKPTTPDKTTTAEKTTSNEKTTVYVTSTEISSTGITTTVIPPHQDNSTTVSGTSPMESKDPADNELTPIIAGAGGGGLVVIVIILIAVICMRMRKTTPKKESVKSELDTNHKNDAYDHEEHLPDNPLYHSNHQSENEVGYSTVEEQHHRSLPPSQTNTGHSDNAKSLATNRQSKDHTPDIPVYAVPNKPKNTPTETTGGAVYAQINKPKKNTAQAPVRTQNQEGLVYMEVEHSSAPITQNTPNINVSNAESVMYAEIEK